MAKNKFKHWKNKYELAKININIGKHEYTLARNKYNYMFLKLKNICKRICRQSQNIVGVGNNKHIAGQIHGRDTARCTSQRTKHICRACRSIQHDQEKAGYIKLYE